MTSPPATRSSRNLPLIEAGSRESALCTIANVAAALETLREVRKHVRGDHKRRLDDVAVILRVIAFDTQATYAITDDEAREFIRKCRPV